MTFDPCVIDSEATDHMTGCENLFTTYSPSPRNIKIRIADGTFLAIAGNGTIKIAQNITLLSVLHVPRLTCKLLSISKIPKNMNCMSVSKTSPHFLSISYIQIIKNHLQ